MKTETKKIYKYKSDQDSAEVNALPDEVKFHLSRRIWNNSLLLMQKNCYSKLHQCRLKSDSMACKSKVKKDECRYCFVTMPTVHMFLTDTMKTKSLIGSVRKIEALS